MLVPDDDHITRNALLDLPIEISSMILSRLPAKEIQHLRRVCKHYRSLIDNKDNRSLFISPGMRRSVEVIQADRRLICRPDVATTSLYEYMCRVLARRGLRESQASVRFTTAVVAWQWAGSCPKLRAMLKRDASRHAARELITPLAIMTSGLVRAHIGRHRPELSPLLGISSADHFDSVIEISGVLSVPEFTELGLTRDRLHQWYHDIADQAAGMDSIIGEHSRLPMAEFVLTRLIYYAHDLEEVVGPEKVRRVEGLCSVQRLGEVLNLRLRPVEPVSAYCAKSQRTYDMVEAAILYGNILSVLEQAAIVEELYVY